MKEWARWFYLSKAWRSTRRAKLIETYGLCEICHKPAEIVHHKIHLTPQNIENPEIALNMNNLLCVCRECHAVIHEGTGATAEGLKFDENGNVILEEGTHAEQDYPRAYGNNEIFRNGGRGPFQNLRH